MLKSLKRAVLRGARLSGTFSLVKRSGWRRSRLLILCYHGIALYDEHEWNPELYMSAEAFDRRMALVQRSGCHVLPLGEAVERLYGDDLPTCSVAITFDDGTYDFYRRARPVLQKYGFPVTVYLTTFYSDHRKPVFRLICSYMLWKQRTRTADFTGIAGLNGSVDLQLESSRARILDALTGYVDGHHLSADEKDHLAIAVGERLGIDYEDLRAKRLIQIMSPAEVSDIAREGVDVQLHTHRHRTPMDATLFKREISDNRVVIEAITQVPAVHFCYPSGVHRPEFLPWLTSEGVATATTCEPGLVSGSSPRLLLPRLVDHSHLSDVEFEGWLCGVSAMLPRRGHVMDG